MVTLVLLAALTTAAVPPGFVSNPRTGQTRAGASTVGISILFDMWASSPNAPVEIQVLKRPDLDPAVDANWVVLQTAYSSTTPYQWNPASTDPLYQIVAWATPVPTATEAARWPVGKMVKFRVIAKFQPGSPRLYSLEEDSLMSCYGDHALERWQDYLTACASPYPTLTLASTALNPADAAVGVNTYDYLGKKQDSTSAQTALYYTAAGLPTTLNGFKQLYGFPTDEVTAVYYNAGDLGFGREMHCKSFDVLLGTGLLGKGVACYVNNYGNTAGQPAFPATPANALTLAHSGAGAFATVAMVYTPPHLPNSIKFVVYDSTGARSNVAPLDSTGRHQSVPNNCLACHGISSNANLAGTGIPVVSMDARFLPFDPYSFAFRSQADFEAQRENFRKLNALVALTPMSPETNKFILGLYAGKPPSDPTATSIIDFVPPAWKTTIADRTIYDGVIRPYCRGCHMTSTSTAYDFDSPADFVPSYIHGVPCESTHRMPHAEQTLRNFWNGGARVYLTNRYSLANFCSP